MERQRWEKSEKRREEKESEERRCAWKARKVTKHCVFPMFCGSGGSKTRLAKAAGAGTSGQMRNDKLRPLWREAHFQVKLYKTPQLRTAFGSWDVEKARAVAARSTCGSQNVQSTLAPDHFWKLRHRKSARRCGAKHIWKSKRKWKKCGFEWQAQGIRHLGDCLRGVAFWSVRSSGLLRRFCITCAALRALYDLASLFRGWRNTVDSWKWTGKVQKALVRRCTQLSVFEGCLAELLGFWCCQLGKLRQSRRIASFLPLSSSKIEEVAHNRFVFKLADR